MSPRTAAGQNATTALKKWSIGGGGGGGGARSRDPGIWPESRNPGYLGMAGNGVSGRSETGFPGGQNQGSQNGQNPGQNLGSQKVRANRPIGQKGVSNNGKYVVFQGLETGF